LLDELQDDCEVGTNMSLSHDDDDDDDEEEEEEEEKYVFFP
jgi:hypothetical protein